MTLPFSAALLTPEDFFLSITPSKCCALTTGTCVTIHETSHCNRDIKKQNKTGFGSGVVVSELLCKGTLLPLKAFLCPTTTTKVPVNNIMAVDHSESNFHFWHAFSAMRVGSSMFFNLCDRGSRCGQGR